MGEALPTIIVESIGRRGGWREYRRTRRDGRLRYPIDRWWVPGATGGWRKQGRHRADVRPMTEEDYEHWKQTRDAARRAAREPAGLRELAAGQ